MGIVQKESVKSTVISYIGILIGFINIAILFPKYFHPDELGLRSILVEFSFIISQFALFGFGAVGGKFFYHFETKNASHHNGFLFFICFIPFIGFFIVSALLYAFRDVLFISYKSSSLLAEYYYLIIPLTFFTIYQILFEVYIRAFYKTVFSIFVKEILIRILTTVLILLYAFDFINAKQFWSLFTASYGICLIALVLYTIRIGNFDWRPDLGFLKRSMIKEILVFASFSLFAGLAGIIVTKVDTVMLTYMLTLEDTGIFALALYISSVIDIPKKSITQIITPIISSAFKDNDLKTIYEIYKKTALNQLIIGGFIFLLIWINIDPIFNLIPNGALYQKGKYAVFFIGLSKLFDMATGANSEIISFSKYYKVGFYSVIFLVFSAVTTNYMFIPVFNVTGAAIAAAVSTLLFNVFKFLFLYFKFNFQPFSKQSLITCIIGISSYLLSFHITVSSDFFTIFLRGSVFSVSFLSVILFLKISPDINLVSINIYNKMFSLIKKTR